jgi:chromosome segregation ATPase
MTSRFAVHASHQRHPHDTHGEDRYNPEHDRQQDSVSSADSAEYHMAPENISLTSSSHRDTIERIKQLLDWDSDEHDDLVNKISELLEENQEKDKLLRDLNIENDALLAKNTHLHDEIDSAQDTLHQLQSHLSTFINNFMQTQQQAKETASHRDRLHSSLHGTTHLHKNAAQHVDGSHRRKLRETQSLSSHGHVSPSTILQDIQEAKTTEHTAGYA